MKLATISVTRVRDVMTRPVVTVHAHDTIATAEEVLRAHRIGGAPVVSAAGTVVGVVSSTDLAGVSDAERAEGSVLDRTTRVLYGVREDDPLLLAVRLMTEQRIHRVFVLDDGHRLVGLVTPMDVMRALLDRPALAAGTDEQLTYVEVASQGPVAR